ncbi:MAG: flavodoxin family protein [Salinispira sp.]
MKIAVLFFPLNSRKKIHKISEALAGGIEAQGYQVDRIDGSEAVHMGLSIYQYIVIGAEFGSAFNSKIPEIIPRYLKNAGLIAGKRSLAFILPKFFGTEKALRNIMAVMESEGMFVKNSEIISDERLAMKIGKNLTIRS